MRPRLLALVCVTVLVLSAALPRAQAPAPARRPAAPGLRLIVLVAVDQFRADYLTRFASEYTGGLHRLLTRGAVFTNAYLEHYPTVTAVGHATMLTGATPSVSGIIGNDWYDRDTRGTVQSITDTTVALLGGGTGTGASPRRLLASTVGDELKMAAPRDDAARMPKVFGISMKDRSAILPAGHGADGAFWLPAANGPFVSSTYYFGALPPWVTAYNARPVPAPGDMVNTTARVLALATEAISAEHLGQRGVTDLLSVSLSDNDTVGHAQGPDSPQVHAVSLRTDQQLGTFFAMLDAKVGLDHTLVVLTADHGVAPVPEVQRDRRLPGGRIDAQTLFPPITAALEARFGPGQWLLATAGTSPYLNHALIAERQLDAEEVRRVAAAAAMRTPHVIRVYTRDQLQRGEVTQDLIGRRVLRGFNAQRSGDLEIVFEPYWMRAATGTTHGSPHNYDAHIPLVFMGPQVTAGRYHDAVALNDLAPTVAALAAVDAPSGSSGRVLSEMLTGRPAGSRVPPAPVPHP